MSTKWVVLFQRGQIDRVVHGVAATCRFSSRFVPRLVNGSTHDPEERFMTGVSGKPTARGHWRRSSTLTADGFGQYIPASLRRRHRRRSAMLRGHHEADLSTEQHSPQAHARISRPHGHPRRSPCDKKPPGQGSGAPRSLT